MNLMSPVKDALPRVRLKADVDPTKRAYQSTERQLFHTDGSDVVGLLCLQKSKSGGLSSLSGALYGALFIQFVPGAAEQVSKAAPWAVYGAILLALMLAWPTGAAGALARVTTWITTRSKP